MVRAVPGPSDAHSVGKAMIAVPGQVDGDQQREPRPPGRGGQLPGCKLDVQHREDNQGNEFEDEHERQRSEADHDARPCFWLDVSGCLSGIAAQGGSLDRHADDEHGERIHHGGVLNVTPEFRRYLFHRLTFTTHRVRSSRMAGSTPRVGGANVTDSQSVCSDGPMTSFFRPMSHTSTCLLATARLVNARISDRDGTGSTGRGLDRLVVAVIGRSHRTVGGRVARGWPR